MKKIFILSSLIAVTLATPSFAEPTELDKKTVASKAYVDTKQDLIDSGNVLLDNFDDNNVYVPGLVAYDSTTQTLKGNQVGILDWVTLDTVGMVLDDYSDRDDLVPTVAAVSQVLSAMWDIMPQQWQALSWNVNNDNGANRTNAINAYNTTFGTGTNQWAGTTNSGDLINGQFLANSLALKQNKITTGLVEFNDNPEYMLPAITTYDSTSGLVANKIGILDQETIANNEGDLYLYSNGGGGYGSEMDNFVPTVRAVAESLHAIRSDLETFQWSYVKHPAAINAYSTTFDGTTTNWPRDDVGKLVETGTFAKALALKQNILPAKWTSTTSSLQMGAKGGQTIELNTAGNVKRRYITAGGSVGLTTRSGAPAVINYVNGTVATTEDMTTFTTGTFGSSNTTNQNYIKNALVSLELLKDVYGELNSKITNNALPTGTTGTVVTYNGVNAETGVQEFGERAVYDPANAYNAQNDATKLATMASVKYVCAGYEPAAAGQPAHDGTHPGDEDYCWLWALPN